jgi:hypothetical protein
LIEQDPGPPSWVPQLFVSINGPLTEIEIEVSGSPPVLFNVIVCAAETCPTAVPGNASEAEFRLSVGAAAPAPVSATVCVPAPSVNVSVPVTAPVCVGVNSTVTWQADSAASVPHALFTIENGELIVTLVTGTATPLLFSTSTCSEADVLPTGTAPKLKLAGITLTAPAAAPVPLSPTVNCPPLTLALIVIWPVRLPVPAGVNVT